MCSFSSVFLKTPYSFYLVATISAVYQACCWCTFCKLGVPGREVAWLACGTFLFSSVKELRCAVAVQTALILSIPRRRPVDETQETLRTSAFPSTHIKEKWAKNLYIGGITYGRTVS